MVPAFGWNNRMKSDVGIASGVSRTIMRAKSLSSSQSLLGEVRHRPWRLDHGDPGARLRGRLEDPGMRGFQVANQSSVESPLRQRSWFAACPWD